MMWLLCLLLLYCCEAFSNDLTGPEYINVTQGNIRDNYNGTVGGIEYQHANLYFFSIPKDKMPYVEPEVERDSWNDTDIHNYPLSINAWSTASALSFMLPMVMQGFRFHMATRYLCPTNESEKSDLYVSVSSASPKPVHYRLQVRTIEKGTFVIKKLDRKVPDFTVGPTWPGHYEFQFPDGVDEVDIVVSAASDDKGYNQPAVMMIQEAKCPMLSDLAESEKAHRVVNFVRQARVTLVRKESYESVFLNFISTMNGTKPTQKKKLRLLITKSSSYMSYTTPIIGAVGVALLVYLLPILLVIGLKRCGRLGMTDAPFGVRAGTTDQADGYDGSGIVASPDDPLRSQDQLIRDPEGEVYPSSTLPGRVYWLDIVHYPRVVGAVAAVTVLVTFAIMLPMSHDYEKMDKCYFNYECLRYAAGITAFNHVFSHAFAYGTCAIFIVFYNVLLSCCIPGSSKMGELANVRPILWAVVLAIAAEGFVSSVFHLCPAPFVHFTENAFLCLALLLGISALYGPLSINLVIYLWIPMVFLSAISEVDAIVIAAFIPLGLTSWHIRKKILDENITPRQAFQVPTTYVIIVWCFIQAASSALLHHTIDCPTFLTFSTVIGSLLYFSIHVGKSLKDVSFMNKFGVLSLGLISVAFWGLGLAFYLQKRVNFMASPAYSRSSNGPCVLSHFYDPGDIWAFCSSFALFYQFMSFLFYKLI